MKKLHYSLVFISMGLFSALLVSCGGGGGGSNGGSGTPPAAASVTTFGEIQGFGSIFVNGVEYETTGASFSKDASTNGIDENQLRLGMMVTVHGSKNDDGVTGTAYSVEYRDNLEGPISSIDPATNSFVALGHRVIVDASTIFDGTITFNQLAVGDIVEVSGPTDATGNIRATFIDKSERTCVNVEEIEVKGMVTNLDAAAKSFRIGSLMVDYSGADLSDLSGGLADGKFVEVKSRLCPVDNKMLATRVEAQNEFGQCGESEEGSEAEIQGFVTSITTPTEFKLNNQLVRIIESTRFEGMRRDQIALNTRLEVEGSVSNGVISAQRIQLEN